MIALLEKTAHSGPQVTDGMFSGKSEGRQDGTENEMVSVPAMAHTPW